MRIPKLAIRLGAVAALALLSACFSGLSSKQPAPQRYVLQPPMPQGAAGAAVPAPAPASPQAPGSLAGALPHELR